jgi:hypothetical protein
MLATPMEVEKCMSPQLAIGYHKRVFDPNIEMVRVQGSLPR